MLKVTVLESIQTVPRQSTLYLQSEYLIKLFAEQHLSILKITASGTCLVVSLSCIIALTSL